MKNLIILSVILFSFASISCRNSKGEKAIGTWKQIPFTNPDSVTQMKYWRFYSGDALIITTYHYDENKGDYVDSIQYTYNVDGNDLKVYGDWDYSASSGDPRGQYWIDEINDDYLKMTKRKHPDGSTSGAFLRIELAKQ